MSEDTERKPDPAIQPRKKRKPPIIDASAKDVTPSVTPQAAEEITRVEAATAQESPRQEIPRQETPTDDAAPQSQQPAAKQTNWQVAMPALGVAALSGIAAGLVGAWLFAAEAPPAPPLPDNTALEVTIAQLSARIAKQEAKPEAKPQPATDLAPLNERSAKLETTAAELRGEIVQLRKRLETQGNAPSAGEFSAIERRLALMEERIAALAAAPKQEPQSQTQPAEIVALGALRDAIVAGAPFANELNLVRSLLKERAASLSALDSFAGMGLPSVAEFAKRFAALASKIANPPPPSDGGVFSRLWNNAGKLVEVRPIGEPQGADAGAVVARMEAKLARGDLAGAIEESKTLPPAAREIAKDWLALAEARLQTESTIKSLIHASLSAISGQSKP